jgi:hypothetical protein
MFHHAFQGRMSRKSRAFSETNCPLGVLTANYGNQLSVALNDAPVTWASDAGWVTAKKLVDEYGDLLLYIRGTEEDSESHLVTHMGIAGEIAEYDEDREHAENLMKHLVEGDIMHEGEDAYAHYIRVDDCWELETPFPQDELILDSQDRPVDRNYSRNYAIVQPREKDI